MIKKLITMLSPAATLLIMRWTCCMCFENLHRHQCPCCTGVVICHALGRQGVALRVNGVEKYLLKSIILLTINWFIQFMLWHLCQTINWYSLYIVSVSIIGNARHTEWQNCICLCVFLFVCIIPGSVFVICLLWWPLLISGCISKKRAKLCRPLGLLF